MPQKNLARLLWLAVFAASCDSATSGGSGGSSSGGSKGTGGYAGQAGSAAAGSTSSGGTGLDQKPCAQGCAPLCVSDRDQKKNIGPVDTAAILDKVSRMPISSWTYNKEPAEVRHLGPMAQDFRAAA